MFQEPPFPKEGLKPRARNLAPASKFRSPGPPKGAHSGRNGDQKASHSEVWVTKKGPRASRPPCKQNRCVLPPDHHVTSAPSHVGHCMIHIILPSHPPFHLVNCAMYVNTRRYHGPTMNVPQTCYVRKIHPVPTSTGLRWQCFARSCHVFTNIYALSPGSGTVSSAVAASFPVLNSLSAHADCVFPLIHSTGHAKAPSFD